MSRFDDSFWGTDPVSFQGFDNLCEIMKDGKHTCDDFQLFVKTRAQIEDVYAKSLIKLAKMSCTPPPTGTLHTAWAAMRAETEKQGVTHLRLANELENQIEAQTKQFRDKQRDQRKKTEDVVKKAQKLKVASFDKNVKSKKNYELRCRELDKLNEELQGIAQSQVKEVEKVRQRVAKADQAMQLADQQYKEAVVQLEESRVLWEREMERCCTQFQSLEEERLTFLRNIMWHCTNVLSSACVVDDECFEAVRCSLEKVSVELDIADYIREHRTGSQRPPRVEYQSYYTGSSAS